MYPAPEQCCDLQMALGSCLPYFLPPFGVHKGSLALGNGQRYLLVLFYNWKEYFCGEKGAVGLFQSLG